MDSARAGAMLVLYHTYTGIQSRPIRARDTEAEWHKLRQVGLAYCYIMCGNCGFLA